MNVNNLIEKITNLKIAITDDNPAKRNIQRSAFTNSEISILGDYTISDIKYNSTKGIVEIYIIKREKTPYEKGEAAFYDGKKLDDNPFVNGSSLHKIWRNGYVHADIQESGTQNEKEKNLQMSYKRLSKQTDL